MVDCMCGSNAPVATACAWIGWFVFTAELDGTAFNEPLDLLTPANRSRVEDHAWQADAFVKAMECTTMSKARAIPIPNMTVLPMRGTWFVLGLPEL